MGELFAAKLNRVATMQLCKVAVARWGRHSRRLAVAHRRSQRTLARSLARMRLLSPAWLAWKLYRRHWQETAWQVDGWRIAVSHCRRRRCVKAWAGWRVIASAASAEARQGMHSAATPATPPQAPKQQQQQQQPTAAAAAAVVGSCSGKRKMSEMMSAIAEEEEEEAAEQGDGGVGYSDDSTLSGLGTAWSTPLPEPPESAASGAGAAAAAAAASCAGNHAGPRAYSNDGDEHGGEGDEQQGDNDIMSSSSSSSGRGFAAAWISPRYETGVATALHLEYTAAGRRELVAAQHWFRRLAPRAWTSWIGTYASALVSDCARGR